MGGNQTKIFLLQLLDVFNKFSAIKNFSMSVSMKMAETTSCDDPMWVIEELVLDLALKIGFDAF